MPAPDHPSSWGEAINGDTQLFDLLNSARLLYCLLVLLQAKAEVEVKVQRTKQGFCFKALSIWLRTTGPWSKQGTRTELIPWRFGKDFKGEWRMTQTSRPFFSDRALNGRQPEDKKMKKTEKLASESLAQATSYAEFINNKFINQ